MRCQVYSVAGKCLRKATRIYSFADVKIWLCNVCYEDRHRMQPMTRDQRTVVWDTY